MRALGAAVAAVALTGCFGGPRPESETTVRARALLEPTTTGPDAVAVESVLVERPLGDPDSARDVWKAIDEQFLPRAQRSILADNGFRVGVVSGALPETLRRLATDPRSEAGRRVRSFRLGETSSMPVGEERTPNPFTVYDEGRETPLAPQVARFLVGLTARPAAGGELSLRGVPGFDAPDPARWSPLGSVVAREPDSFHAAGWEATLGPNDFLVVGTTGKEGTVGRELLTGTRDGRAVQRLLILRVFHPDPEAARSGGDGGVVPVAEQVRPRRAGDLSPP